MTSTSRIAPIDAIWVCSACGKTHTDRYGIDGEGSHGWDESCMLNAVLCKRGNIKPGDRVTHAAEPFRSIDRRRTMMEPKWTTEPSERDRKMAREYLDSVTGMENPEDHAAQWFATARTEERERIAALADEWEYKFFAARIRSGQ